MVEIDTDDMPKFELKPSIKLFRNQSGGYRWEIKIVSLDMKHLEKVNDEMIERFGE